MAAGENTNIECCTRCGRDCPDGRQVGLCFKCRKAPAMRPSIVDAAGAARQLKRDLAVIRRQNGVRS